MVNSTLLTILILFCVIFAFFNFATAMDPVLSSALYTIQPGPAEATLYSYFHGGFSCPPPDGCTTNMTMTVNAIEGDATHVPPGVMLVIYFYRGKIGLSNPYIPAHNSVWKFTDNVLEKKPFSKSETSFRIAPDDILFFFGEIVYYNSKPIEIWKFDNLRFSFKFNQPTKPTKRILSFSAFSSSLSNTSHLDENYIFNSNFTPASPAPTFNLHKNSHQDFEFQLSAPISPKDDITDSQSDLSSFELFLSKYSQLDTQSAQFRSIMQKFKTNDHTRLFQPNLLSQNSFQQNNLSQLQNTPLFDGPGDNQWPIKTNLNQDLQFFNSSFSGSRYSFFVDAIRLSKDPSFPNPSHHQLQIRFSHVRTTFQSFVLQLVGQAQFWDFSYGSGQRVSCYSDYGQDFDLRYMSPTKVMGQLSILKDSTTIITCRELRIFPLSNYTQAVYLAMTALGQSSTTMLNLALDEISTQPKNNHTNFAAQFEARIQAILLNSDDNLSHDDIQVNMGSLDDNFNHNHSNTLAEAEETLDPSISPILTLSSSIPSYPSISQLQQLYPLYQQHQVISELQKNRKTDDFDSNSNSLLPSLHILQQDRFRYATFTPVTLSAQYNRRFQFGKQGVIQPITLLAPIGYDWVTQGYKHTYTSSVLCKFQINFTPGPSKEQITQQDISNSKEKFKIALINGIPLSPAYFTITDVNGQLIKHLRIKKPTQGPDVDPFLLYEPFSLYSNSIHVMASRYYLNAWIPLVNSTSETKARNIQCQIWYEQMTQDMTVLPTTTSLSDLDMLDGNNSQANTSTLEDLAYMNESVENNEQSGTGLNGYYDSLWIKEYQSNVESRSVFQDFDHTPPTLKKATKHYSVQATLVDSTSTPTSLPKVEFDEYLNEFGDHMASNIPYPHYSPDIDDLEDPIFTSVLSSYLHNYHKTQPITLNSPSQQSSQQLSQPTNISSTNFLPTQASSNPYIPTQISSKNYQQFNTLSSLTASSSSKTILAANSGTSIYNIMSYPDGRLFSIPGTIKWDYDSYGIPSPPKDNQSFKSNQTFNSSTPATSPSATSSVSPCISPSSSSSSSSSLFPFYIQNQIKLYSTIFYDMISTGSFIQLQQHQDLEQKEQQQRLRSITPLSISIPILSHSLGPKNTSIQNIPITPYRTIYSSPYTIYIDNQGRYMTRELDFGSNYDTLKFFQQPVQQSQQSQQSQQQHETQSTLTSDTLMRPANDKMDSIFFLEPVSSNRTFIYKAEFYFPRLSRDFEELTISFANSAYIFFPSDPSINHCLVNGKSREYSNSTSTDEIPSAFFHSLRFNTFTTYSQTSILISCPGLYIYSQILDTARDDPHFDTDYIFPEHHNALVIEGVAPDYHGNPHKYTQIIPFRHYSLQHASKATFILIVSASALGALLVALIIIRCCFCRTQQRGIKRRGKTNPQDDPNFFIRLDEQTSENVW